MTLGSFLIQISNAEDSVEGVRVEGGSGGAPILHIKDPAQLVDGDTFTVLNTLTLTPTTFEFDDDGVVNPGNILVPYSTLDTPQQVVDKVELAVDNSTFNRLASSSW